MALLVKGLPYKHEDLVWIPRTINTDLWCIFVILVLGRWKPVDLWNSMAIQNSPPEARERPCLSQGMRSEIDLCPTHKHTHTHTHTQYKQDSQFNTQWRPTLCWLCPRDENYVTPSLL